VPHPEDSAADVEPLLTSGVLTSPADGLLREAIAKTLRAEPQVRAELFEQLLREIEDFMSGRPEERPWTCATFTGTDGSRIFRGGTGRSIVIDPLGEMWRARSYEDFDTAYAITSTECRIASLTPHYENMRRYPLE
jgi:hypothetical protein